MSNAIFYLILCAIVVVCAGLAVNIMIENSERKLTKEPIYSIGSRVCQREDYSYLGMVVSVERRGKDILYLVQLEVNDYVTESSLLDFFEYELVDASILERSPDIDYNPS